MNWLRKFMAGRYGLDELSIGLIIISLVFSILSRFTNNKIVSIIFLSTIVMAYYRILSKDISSRYQENLKLLKVLNPIKAKIRGKIKRIKDAKDYRHFKCPSCSQILRVPRGKGRISITCPKCKTGIIKKT